MRFYQFLTLTLLVCLCAKADAQVIEITSGSEHQYIGKQLVSYEDATGQMTINNIVGLPQDSFISHETDVPNLGMNESHYWVKVHLRNSSLDDPLTLLLNQPNLDGVDFFAPDGSGGYKQVHQGEDLPFSERKYQTPSHLFDLNLAKGSEGTYYLRVSALEPVQVPISVAPRYRHFEVLNNRSVLSSIYVGVMLVLMLYNLFVFFSVNDRSYLFYVIYIAIMMVLQVASFGLPFEYLWPNSSFMAKSTFIIWPVLSGLAFIEFSKSYLKLKEISPPLYKGTFILAGAYIITLIMAASGLAQISFQVIQMVAMLLAMYTILMGVAGIRKGYRPARYYLFAWSIFLGGLMIFILKDVGVLPYNEFTNYMMPVGSALEGILLSFGLADRINTLKREKEESQAKALAVSQENERIIREQNVILEQKVTERTAELQESNEELNVTLEHLKETQSQLVEAEKMASLGQLTAGIAHEINNPINFVTANINPLKRDIEDLFLVFSKYDGIDPSTDLKEELKKINALKEELDTDYLKEEINQLLEGMEEGASRTAEIVKGLRLFSRLDEDVLKDADINEGLDATLTILKSEMNGKTDVVREFGDLPLIECYPGKLNQLFMNIINNAIQAIEDRENNEKPGIITIKTMVENEQISVMIRDNGKGMNEATRNRIFEPFFTTKDVGQGTGLGLSIAYKICEMHHGNIQVESEVGKGTNFIITLPLKQPADEDETTGN